MATLNTVRAEAKHPECPYTEFRLRELIKQGLCPGVRCGNRFMINHDALVAMVNEQSVKNANGHS